MQRLTRENKLSIKGFNAAGEGSEGKSGGVCGVGLRALTTIRAHRNLRNVSHGSPQ